MAGNTRICKETGDPFRVSTIEEDYCRRLGLPLPKISPLQRLKRRLAFTNPYSVFQKKSDKTGKMIFSMIPPTAEIRVVEREHWWSDAWDPLQFGKPVDFKQAFLKQVEGLATKVPHFPLSVVRIENSDYVNNASGLKNCYMVFSTSNAEGCYYCDHTSESRDCLDCSRTCYSELCYDCTMCETCYNLQSSNHCDNCRDSYFLYECKSCRNCFGCAALRHAEYHIFNEPVGKEDYQAFIKNLSLESYSERKKLAEEAHKIWGQYGKGGDIISKSEDVTGCYLYNCNRVYESIFVWTSQDMYNVFQVFNSRDCVDFSLWGDDAELVYNSVLVGNHAHNIKCCLECYENVRDLEYCMFCIQCCDCFGCVGLRHKQYCILNQQFTKNEYHDLKERIINFMKKEETYGEFFSPSVSFAPYNLSFAAHYFPLTEAQAREEGYFWYEAPEPKNADNSTSVLPDGLPENNSSFITKSISSGRPFRITEREIKLYRRFHVPLPRETYNERISARWKLLR